MKRRIIVLLLAAFLLTGCFGKEKNAETIPPTAASTAPAKTVREGLQTVLMACVDEYDAPDNSGTQRNNSRADFLMLLVIDTAAGRTTALHLNPDTAVPFAVPGTGETVESTLGLLYSYGSGGSDSFLNGTKAVSRLLGISPDHYLILTADSIGIVHDMLGGVALPGAEHALSAEEAADFFRLREEGDSENAAHMENQREYMRALYGPLFQNAQNEDFLTDLTLRLGDRMNTDLTLSQMVKTMELLNGSPLEENIITLKGSAEKAEEGFRFRVDAEDLDEIIRVLFY